MSSSTSTAENPQPFTDRRDEILVRAFGTPAPASIWQRWSDRAISLLHEFAYYAGTMPAPGSDLDIYPPFEIPLRDQTSTRHRPD